MTPVEKALWFIEGHFADSIELDDIAAAGGVSRFYLTRAFVAATGQSAVRYLRGRRLSEAARALAAGAPDILAVALDAGYGSHEAFTRAFRDLFGMTPEQVRAQGHLDNVTLVEPIIMNQTLLPHLEEPRLVDGPPMVIAGLDMRYSCDSSKAVPSQWQRFAPHDGAIPGQRGAVAYGVCHDADDDGNFSYLTGVEVDDAARVPRDLATVRLKAQRYAVFAHREHVSTIRRTVHTIWSQWLPQSRHEVADAPNFERYGPEFDPRTGLGGLEIWIPLKA